jgi:serine phosphatase RsbU (regulator of sigma subunit)
LSLASGRPVAFSVAGGPEGYEVRLEKELRFAQRVKAALLPTDLPERLKGVDVAARFTQAHGLGGDLHDFLAPEPNGLLVAIGDVSSTGVPAALDSAFVGELVRSLTFRRRFRPERSSPTAVLASMNTILHKRQLEDYCILNSACSISRVGRSSWPIPACRIPFAVQRGRSTTNEHRD